LDNREIFRIRDILLERQFRLALLQGSESAVENLQIGSTSQLNSMMVEFLNV
jgi:hypothetical protein